MKKYKHPITGEVVTVTNPNHYSIYERYGYEEIKDKKKKEDQ